MTLAFFTVEIYGTETIALQEHSADRVRVRQREKEGGMSDISLRGKSP